MTLLETRTSPGARPTVASPPTRTPPAHGELARCLEGELAQVGEEELAAEAARVRAQASDAFEAPAASHLVRPGDTLSRIARDHGVSLSALIRANPSITNPDLIHVGDRVRIPATARYAPGSPEQIALFRDAARLVGVPEAWASDPGLIEILRRESGGRVGIPNYTYGERARDPARWAEVHAELKRGHISARSSATGLGQLLLRNVDRHYPSGRAGIGVPIEEAAGMLSYIRERYGHPATAWARYGTVHEGY